MKRTQKKIRKLITVSTFEACDSIKKAAERQGDEDMLHMLRGVNDDLEASDAKYHKNCSLCMLLRRENQAKMTKIRCTIPPFKNWLKT